MVHSTRPMRMQKRQPNFTPRVDPAKKPRPDKIIHMDLIMNSEGSIEDDSILLVDDTFRGLETPINDKEDVVQEVTMDEIAEIIDIPRNNGELYRVSQKNGNPPIWTYCTKFCIENQRNSDFDP